MGYELIDIALKYLRDVLDAYLVNSFGVEKGIVVLNGLVTQDGQPVQKNQNKIIISMVHLEQETTRQVYGNRMPNGAGVARVNPPVLFNIQTLIGANFDDYSEALKLLTAAIGFFQQNLVLNRASNPDMPQGLDQLQFEIENLSLFDIHNLWSSMGAKYLPSILYKLRHVTIDLERIRQAEERVTQVAGAVLP